MIVVRLPLFPTDTNCWADALVVVADAVGGVDATLEEVGKSVHPISDRLGKDERKQNTCSRNSGGGRGSRNR